MTRPKYPSPEALRKAPILRVGVGRPPDFNLSRSEGRYLIAVTRAGRIGVDVERLRPIGDLDRIASIYFTAPEAATISDLQDDQKLRAFFACWTAKEAYAKAVGTGLLTRPQSFSFPNGTSSVPGATWATIHGRNWTLYRFEPWPGYTAAVVVAERVFPRAFTWRTGMSTTLTDPDRPGRRVWIRSLHLWPQRCPRPN